MVISEVIVVDRCFNEEPIPHDRLVVGQVSHFLLWKGVRNDVVLVKEVSGFPAFSGALKREGGILECNFCFTRIDKADAFHSNSGCTSSWDESWGGIDHVWIVKSKRDVVVRIVDTVKSYLNGQNVGFGVHRNLAADGAVVHQLARLVNSFRRVSKSNFYIFARWVLTNEVNSCDSHHLVCLVL